MLFRDMNKRGSVRGSVKNTSNTSNTKKVTKNGPSRDKASKVQTLSGDQCLAYYLDTGQILELVQGVVAAVKKRAFTIEELLPDIDNFLRNILVKEKLSALAEKRRKYYVERLDVIKFNPPSLPPRPDGGLMKFPSGGGSPQPTSPQTNAKTATNTTKSSPKVTNNKATSISSPKLIKSSQPGLTNGKSTNIALHSIQNGKDEPIEENIYADMDDSDLECPPNPDDHYLIPEEASKSGSLGSKSQKSWSDSDSGTSYESYGEEDPDSSTYMNIDSTTGATDEVPLPNVQILSVASPPWEDHRVAKKKKKIRQGEELPIATLPNVTFRGDLYHKGSWSWKRRYCVISDNRMIVYKSEKDAQPILKFVLLGYDVTYLEKEGRRNNVIRVSHQGCDTHFFSTDLKEIADLWICHLSPASTVEAPSSGDSANLCQDATKTSTSSPSIQHSTSTSNMSSSEGGSGDGVVVHDTVVITSDIVVKPSDKSLHKTPSFNEDRRPSGAEKKKKNILSDILGTFSKKKGQKVKKNIILGDLPTDPDATIRGILDVFHETRTGNEWLQKFCLIKNYELHCYHDNLADGVEFSLPLRGADIESAGKETKKELSIRLNLTNGEVIILDTSDMIEQGKWLHAVIQAREGLLPDKDDPILYENQEIFPSSGPAEGDPDDIYDEVDTDRMVDSNRGTVRTVIRTINASAPSKPVLRTSSGASVKSTTSVGSTASDVSTGRPPPLPSSDPPKRPLPSKKRRSQEETEMYQNYEEKDTSNLSQEMASAFSQIKSKMENDSSPRSKYKVTETKTTKNSAVMKTKSVAASSPKVEDGVIKCHLGPTIAEDQELLQMTQNPILSTLRDEKRKGSLDAESLNTQIEDMKRKILTMKKQKSDLRGRLLTCRLGREKHNLEVQLQDLDQIIEESEKSITKLHLLAQEKGGSLSRNSSFQSQASSGSSSRSNSLRQGTVAERPGTLSSTNQKAKDVKSSNISSKTSPRSKSDTKAPGAGRVTSPGSGSKVTKTTTLGSTTTKSTVSKATGGKVTATNGSKHTASTTATSKNTTSSTKTTPTAATRTSLTRGNSSTNTPRKVTTVSSTTGKTETPRIGQTRIRTVHTSTTVRTVAGQKGGATTTVSSQHNSSQVKGVKERLKLWESRQEDSTC